MHRKGLPCARAEAVMTFKLTRLTLVAALLPAAAQAQAEETKLRVSVFPASQYVALFVAQDQGFFKRRGLDVEIAFTPNSVALRDGHANGAHQIAHTAVDNAGEMVDVAKADAVIVA